MLVALSRLTALLLIASWLPLLLMLSRRWVCGMPAGLRPEETRKLTTLLPAPAP